MPRTIDLLVIHCSDSPDEDDLYRVTDGVGGKRTPVQAIDSWHMRRGFTREADWRKRFNPQLPAIGYHFVIYRDGTIVDGRHVDEIGAHAQGHNTHSLGICLVGRERFSLAQWRALKAHIESLQARYPAADVVGHRMLRGVTKTCPNFDVAAWLAGGMAPLAGHIHGAVTR